MELSWLIKYDKGGNYEKNILIVLSVFLLLFSLAGCAQEDEKQNVTTTTTVITTVPETTTKAGISKDKAIAVAKNEVNYIIEDEIYDEYFEIVNTSQYEFSYASATFNESTNKWTVELLGQCYAKEFGTGRHVGFYAFEVKIYVTTRGLVDGSVVTGIGRM